MYKSHIMWLCKICANPRKIYNQIFLLTLDFGEKPRGYLLLKSHI